MPARNYSRVDPSSKRVRVSAMVARRLAVTKQHLAGSLPHKPDDKAILDVFRDIGCVQLDPISVVAPSHLLVLWSRLGNFDESELDRLMWRDKNLFEYWAHQASIVMMDDYPLYYHMMRGYPQTFLKPWGKSWRERVQRYLDKTQALQDYVLDELKRRGPLLSRQFEDKALTKRSGSGWGSYSDVSRILFHLFFAGKVMVAGRQGNQKLWDLTERFLPNWASKKELTDDEVQLEAVERAVKALGVANGADVEYHFLRGRYADPDETLQKLEGRSRLSKVEIAGVPNPRGETYVHSDDLAYLESLNSDDWQPRLTLLSPFDNLICDRNRTKRLFDFDFTAEIYTPKAKRKYGYYVMPILYGDRLIGRIDPIMDRNNEKLVINAIHPERNVPKDKNTAKKIRVTIENLSEFLGAREVAYSRRVPAFWKPVLH